MSQGGVVKISYDPENAGFLIKQDSYKQFFVQEGYLQRIIDSFLDPEGVEQGTSLYTTFFVFYEKVEETVKFRVTPKPEYLILANSIRGEKVTLLRMSLSDAKKWAEYVVSLYGPVIRSYKW